MHQESRKETWKNKGKAPEEEGRAVWALWQVKAEDMGILRMVLKVGGVRG